MSEFSINLPPRLPTAGQAPNILTAIIPDALRDAHTLGFSKLLITARPKILNQPIRLKIKTGEGEEVEAEHFIFAEQNNSKWVFGATIKPIPF